MKNQIVFSLTGIALVVLGIFVFNYESKPEIPTVGEDGKIVGSYTLEGIMRLQKPFVCNFEKSEDTSKIVGVIHTDGEKVYGEFKIRSELSQSDFRSFIIINGKESSIWTSLGPVGYKSVTAKSASKNASPVEQAQIVGTRDKFDFKCEPWTNLDTSYFETPSWITFTDLR